MSLENFLGNTFVAFIDISGFKALMKDKKRAYKALDKFYQIGYDALRSNTDKNNAYRVDGIFISDCGILFSRFNGQHLDEVNDFYELQSALKNVLNIIKTISIEMIKDDLMVTASIAYGEFNYEERIKFKGIEKNFMFGNAYLDAYLDNENGKPKLSPGQCRILLNEQQNNFWKTIQNSTEKPFNLITKKQTDVKHLYFYWMVHDEQEIERFDSRYNNTYNLKYQGMITVLKEFSKRNNDR